MNDIVQRIQWIWAGSHRTQLLQGLQGLLILFVACHTLAEHFAVLSWYMPQATKRLPEEAGQQWMWDIAANRGGWTPLEPCESLILNFLWQEQRTDGSNHCAVCLLQQSPQQLRQEQRIFQAPEGIVRAQIQPLPLTLLTCCVLQPINTGALGAQHVQLCAGWAAQPAPLLPSALASAQHLTWRIMQLKSQK